MSRAAATSTAHRQETTGGQIVPGRACYEFYPTPPAATQAFLQHERFKGDIWEPACGQGHISNVLEANGYSVCSTDIHDWGFGTAGVDYLRETAPRAKHIITNPPYGRGLADQFIRKSLGFIEQTGGSAAFLLDLASLAHRIRHQSFLRRPPRIVYILDECVCLPERDPRNATRSTLSRRYCWVVWDAQLSTETRMHWLTTRDESEL